VAPSVEFEKREKAELGVEITPKPTIVNFGCGAYPGEGCINIDHSITVLLAGLPFPARFFGARAGFVQAARDFRIRRGAARRISFPECSLDGFYASHVLEHLSKDDCERLLINVRRWLKPTGVLRVVLPDLRRLAESYLSGNFSADHFVRKTYLAPEARRPWQAFGGVRHLWMYDASSFMAMLRRIDFSDIEETRYGKSRLSGLGKLDLEVRDYESFYVEAGK